MISFAAFIFIVITAPIWISLVVSLIVLILTPFWWLFIGLPMWIYEKTIQTTKEDQYKTIEDFNKEGIYVATGFTIIMLIITMVLVILDEAKYS